MVWKRSVAILAVNVLLLLLGLTPLIPVAQAQVAPPTTPTDEECRFCHTTPREIQVAARSNDAVRAAGLTSFFSQAQEGATRQPAIRASAMPPVREHPIVANKEDVLQGEAIFGQKCRGCHTIGQGKLVGPDLEGVTKRRDELWLKVQIQSPSTHRAQNDPISKTNLVQFGVPMPDLGLTAEQVGAVIAYLKSAEKAPVTIPALYAPTLAMGVLAIVALTIIGLVVGTKRVEVRP